MKNDVTNRSDTLQIDPIHYKSIRKSTSSVGFHERGEGQSSFFLGITLSLEAIALK